MPAFTPDAVRVLDPDLAGPVLEQRLAAAERFAATELPTADEEIWRYSRIGELDLERFGPAAVATDVTGAERVGTQLPPGGLELFPGDAPDAFAELNAAFMSPVVLTIPKGMVVDGPITVTHTVTAGGAAVFPRLVIDAGADSEVTVIERFLSPDNVSALVVPVLHVRAQQAARVKYLAVNELGVDTWQIGNQQAIGERDSTIMLATVALGGDYARVRTEARVSGAGASTRQVALYFAGGSQMHDFRTIQDHDAPHTTSDLLFKGAVQDSARSVYTGLIKIREHAGGSVAFQTNRNLTLSKGAWAESVPNLDIRTNDVKCSHASTVGPIDEEQRFYLESRGIEPSVAERLVVLGFFDEVLQQLPSGPLADELRRRVAAKLVIGSPAEVGVSSTVVCSFDELAPGSARRFEIDGVAVAVVRIDDDVYAIGDVCSHANVSLSDGEVWCDEREIECPKHGSTFDLTTGQPVTLPATQPVPVFDASVVDGNIVVNITLDSVDISSASRDVVDQ